MLEAKPLLESEVATVITRVLKDCGRFPPNATPWQQGRNVFEGLELRPDGSVRLWWQRHLATSPYQFSRAKALGFHELNKSRRTVCPERVDGAASWN
jgi:hypothetical protein